MELTEKERKEKELSVMNLDNQIEQQKLHRKQLADKIEADYFQRKAKLDLEAMDNEVDRLEKNKQFYEKQLETGLKEPYKEAKGEQTDSSQESEENKQEDTRTR